MELKNCSNCGTEARLDAKFCPHCGDKFSQKNICRNCGVQLPTNVKFCHKCGEKIGVTHSKSEADTRELYGKSSLAEKKPKIKQPSFLSTILSTTGIVIALVIFLGKISFEEDTGIVQKGSIAYEQGDYATALKWYREAAEQGNASAQYNLGVMYVKGEGVTQNYQEAVKWYRKSAEQGLDLSQINLGAMYSNGQGVTQNYQEAVKWYRKAAAQGNASAQYNLGVMYDNGQGVTPNNQEAVNWYRKAAAQGLATAQKRLKELGLE